MAVFSRKHNYLFFASPQTGSKAIMKTLVEKLDGEQMPKKEIKRNGKVIANKHHTTYKMLLNAELLTQSELDSAFKFSGVRNPYDLQVSRYLKLKGRFAESGEKANYAKKNEKVVERVQIANTMDFPQWLVEVHKEFISDDGSVRPIRGPMVFLEHADFVIRFETLQQGFDEFLQRIGVKDNIQVYEHNVTTERVDSGKKRDYREFYDAASIELCGKLYAPIIEKFGYTFDPK